MVQDTQDDLTLLVDQMTVAEKADLLSGRGLWKTAAIERLGIPPILMTDGAYGVRYSTTQIDAGDSDDNSLQGFLALVNQQADDAGTMFGTTRPATCFPNGNLLGCSWDVDLAYRMGAALAAECQNFGVHLLLGPGINTRRTPLAGRAYEYYSEDPVINGDLAAALICGLQDNGVGASLKHFACNNSEIDRTTTSSDVDERALREIYLAGFERAIEKGKPWTVMSAYNPVNGIHATQNPMAVDDGAARGMGLCRARPLRLACNQGQAGFAHSRNRSRYAGKQTAQGAASCCNRNRQSRPGNR